MRPIALQVTFTEYDSSEELPPEDQELIREARKVMDSAYAPYSRFHVGAALRMEHGAIVTGSNQENASYPEGLCAERVALFSAGAVHPGIKIKTLAVVAASKNHRIDKPVTPCGACRQVIAEYEHRYSQPIRLIMTGETGKVLVADGIRQLLPFLFNGDDLKSK